LIYISFSLLRGDNLQQYFIFHTLYLYLTDRVGSEFWKQQERFGDDDTGIQ